MNTDPTSPTFLLSDDHSMIRQGISFLIEEILPESIILQSSTLLRTLEIVRENDVDIIIIDAHFPEGNSHTIFGQLKEINPLLKILVFSGLDENANALKYISAGSNGFLSKLSEENEIKEAIFKMINFGEYFSSTTQKIIVNSLKNPQSINPLDQLSERELLVANLYAKGLGNLEIANQLDLKQNTISTMKKRIFDKLNITTIIELFEILQNNE